MAAIEQASIQKRMRDTVSATCRRLIVLARVEGSYMRILVLLVLLLAVSGCSTKYQSMGFSGGVDAEQVTADTWRIRARGNSYTNATTVQDFVLLKAAETTQAAGGTHFQLISAADASRSFTTISRGTEFVGPQVNTSIKPGQDAYIRVLKVSPGQDAGGALSAAEIVQFTGPRVPRG